MAANTLYNTNRCSNRIKEVLLPVGIWIAAGMVGEILGILTEALLSIRSGSAVPGFYDLLDSAHRDGEILLLLFRNIAAGAVLFALLRRDTEVFGETAGERRPGKVSLSFAVPAVASGVLYCLFMNYLFAALGVLSSESARETGVVGALTAVQELIAAPVVEEILCRGLIYRRVRSYSAPVFGSLISAGIFAVLHWSPVLSVFAFFFGLLLCDLYEWTGKLWVPVLAHSACNLAALLAERLGFASEVPKFGLLLRSAGFGLLLGGAIFVMAKTAGDIRKDPAAGRREKEER